MPKSPQDQADVDTTNDPFESVNRTIFDVNDFLDRLLLRPLAELYRAVWALGNAGVEVPLTLYRDGVTFDVRVNSSDRAKFLKAPKLH